MRHLLYLCLIAVVFIYSCKKHQADAVNPPVTNTTDTGCNAKNFHIYCAGNLFINQPLQFSSDVPSCKTIKWVFRDGTTSTDASPKHSFANAKDYEVTIIIDGDSANLKGLNPYLILSINNPYDAATVAKMGTLRLWDVTQDSLNRITYAKTTFNTHTENFAITILNDSMLLFKTDTLVAFNKSVGVQDVYTFFSTSYGVFKYQNLYYYYKQDSIVCNIHPDQGGLPAAGKHGATLYGITTNYVSHK